MSDQNLLLARFPPDVRKRVVQRVESISLRRGQVLFQAGAPVPHAFFPIGGCVSLESSALSITTLALTTVGKEGMVGVSIVLREPTAPYAAVVRADGHACRLDAKDLLSEVDRSPAFQHTLLEYAARVFVQISQAANCVSAHNTLRRLDGEYPSAAESVREGLEETLTIIGLRLSPALRRSLSTTNAAESLISRTRHVKRNVKRWRGGQMVLRWVAAGVLEAVKGFRRLKGHKEMPTLVTALRVRDQQLGFVKAVENVA